MKAPIILVLVLVTIASLTGCAPVPQTPPATPWIITVIVPATPQPATSTPVPTLTPTAIPAPPTAPAPIFTSYASLNCRSEPWVTDDRWHDNRVSALNVGQTVPILERTSTGHTWWYVNVNGVNCWVSGNYGYTSGNINQVPFVWVSPPSWPWHQNESVRVRFKNETGSSICRIDLYVGRNLVRSIPWEKNTFRDGDTRRVFLPSGRYTTVDAYNCKPKSREVGSLPNIVVNNEHDTFEFVP